MLPGLICTLVISEPKIHGAPPKTIREAVVLPFTEFIGRAGWKSALFILSFIFLYKLGDSLATALATKFYLDLGFTMTQIGVIAKTTGFWASLIGGLLGGIWIIGWESTGPCGSSAPFRRWLFSDFHGCRWKAPIRCCLPP